MKPFLLFIFSFILTSCGNGIDLAKEEAHVDSLAKSQQSITQTPIIDDSLSGKEQELYKKHINLRSKSIYLQTTYPNDPTGEQGGGILVRTEKKLYLITNYHIIPGRQFLDTLKFEGPHLSNPDQLLIFFHSKTADAPAIKFPYRLYDDQGKRNFLTLPQNFSHTAMGKPNEVIDIAFIPLRENDLPKDILLDTVNLYAAVTNSEKGDLVSIWGYRRDTPNNKYPLVDTAIITSSTSYPGYDKYIFYSAHKSINGDSGGLVYIHKGNKVAFLGLHSSGFYMSSGRVPDGFADGTLNQQIKTGISKAFIQKALKYIEKQQ